MSELAIGDRVITQQAGIKQTVTGVYLGPDELTGFAQVEWTTPTGRTLVGRFPAVNTHNLSAVLARVAELDAQLEALGERRITSSV